VFLSIKITYVLAHGLLAVLTWAFKTAEQVGHRALEVADPPTGGVFVFLGIQQVKLAQRPDGIRRAAAVPVALMLR
jgi:hypothetical protein